MQKFFADKRPHNGLTYSQYIERFEKVVNSFDVTNEQLKKDFDLLKLNLQRFQRIYRTYKPGSEIVSLASGLKTKQIWMIITQDKCGDSAQLIPIISRIAEHNGNIDLRIILRDDNLDIMDLYLTGTSRSVPKLVAFDTDGNELFQCGPRPAAAQEFFLNGLKEGREKKELNQELHAWYAKDKGQSFEKGFIELLSNLT